MKFLTQLPDDVLQNVLGMSRLAIHNMRRAWTSLSAEERKAKLQTERADLAKFLGCLNYRSQTIARIDGALYNLDLCKGRFCPVCSGKKGAVFRRKIERFICALYDKETRYLTPDGPEGPSITIIVPKPEAEFPPAIKQALEKRRAATKVGSAVLLTLTISKGAGENRCEVLSKAVKNFKMRSQDPRRRAEYRELGICFSFSAYEQTSGIEGVHHHFHAMLVMNHCIEPNAEAELIFSKKIERLYLRELKAVLKDKWSEEYLSPCYKGQAYSCETIPTEFGETPIFYRWQQKHADEWRPCSEQDYKRLQRLKKCSRPILNIVTRDQDEAFATGLNEMSSAIEGGKRKWRVCRRSPIKGGVSVQSGATVQQYISKAGWSIGDELSNGNVKQGRGPKSLSAGQMIRLLAIVSERRLGTFIGRSSRYGIVKSYDLKYWFPANVALLKASYDACECDPIPDSITFDTNNNVLCGYVESYLFALTKLHKKWTFKVDREGRKGVDKYFSEVVQVKPQELKIFNLASDREMAGLQLRQIISKAVEMEEVTDELKKRFIRLYEKDLKIRHMAFGNIGTLTRQLKTAIKRGDIIEATRIESLRDARRLGKNEVFQVVKILLRFIVHCRPDFFNDHDRARLLKQANPSSYEKCSVATIRLRDLLLNEPKYLEAIEEIASFCKELSPPDLLDLSKEANTSDKKLHAPKGSIAA